nr:MAG TPA: hypothetical protein [Caudoviricetes sp.]
MKLSHNDIESVPRQLNFPFQPLLSFTVIIL